MKIRITFSQMKQHSCSRKIQFLWLISAFSFSGVLGQPPAPPFSYSPPVDIVQDAAHYRKDVQRALGMEMTDLSLLIPDLLVDLKYAGTDNFMHETLYAAQARPLLRRAPAMALREVQAGLAAEGLQLKIWDAYRPYSVTCRMWEKIGDERYVADPSKGSGHNRGIAVDLTLVDRATGRELDMGTGFDDFSEKAHWEGNMLSADIRANRQRLRTAMEKAGFTALETEWWHYYWKGQTYPLMNVDFDQFPARP